MAASTQPAEKPHKILAFALLLIVPLLNGILAEELIVATKVPSETIRGDDIPKARPDGQYPVQLTLQNTSEPTKTLTTEKEGNHNGNDPTTPKKAASEGTKPTEKTTTIPGTPPPIPHRGDGHDNKPKPVQDDVVCVIKETVEGKNAVHLKLKAVSNCEDTQNKIVSVLEDLCGEDCKLEIYQEAGTNEAIVSGKKIEDDVTGMTNKFNNDNIKDKTNVEEATNRWGKNSKLVLVSLLLAGLLLAALLVAGYYLKMHRKTSKGVRLAESFQVDEENQANTLVSVAPLPQEPVDKPTANGESPPENGNNLPPTTNGHSANQTQVADTEM
ncbi:hematopoietic progenitor cell antigen CD34 isoform X2 [Oryzias latipes]|uniref:hematopoietic progenitor cell antigen CD34 isoform X2 n=1 Tax=Oryzias latipes TaxID=8090 RepID=UPI0009DB6AE3|nr:hematopoietic progenitor cell antigen CD34 isoform X2 [Oryzias latipes]